MSAYFWKNGKVLTVEGKVYLSDVIRLKLTKLFCIDDNYVDPDMRYGMFLKTHWEHIPMEKLPKQLLTHVLLLT